MKINAKNASWGSIESYIKASVESALGNEVFETIKEVELSHIKTDVYEAYDPKVYQRRGSAGGLASPDNIVGIVDGGSLEVINTTPPNDYYEHSISTGESIADAIEHGHDYDFFNPGARPFTRNTVQELKASGKHVEALREGLQKLGIKAKK